MEWWSIEVLDGRYQAARWKDVHGNWLTEAAVTNGAKDWAWREHSWGVAFEVRFATDAEWELFRNLPGVKAALDDVPDPVAGLLIHRGHGGAAGDLVPRRPRPFAGAGAIALPEPVPEPRDAISQFVTLP
jgi:hypothetical protein